MTEAVPQIHITQGEHATGRGRDLVITTLLGSCVSCCLWDETAQVGGMNHMLLVGAQSHASKETLASIHEIEILINDLIKLGGQRERLQAKIFGGARMIAGLSEIGEKNARFTERYLAKEGIPVITKSLLGDQARSVRFWPGTGRALVRLTNTKVKEVQVDFSKIPESGLELF